MVFHTTGMSNFPTLEVRDLLPLLQRRPLSCSIMRTRESHWTLRTPTGRTFRYSYHVAREFSGYRVRDVLMDDLWLTENEALEVSLWRSANLKYLKMIIEGISFEEVFLANSKVTNLNIPFLDFSETIEFSLGWRISSWTGTSNCSGTSRPV